MFLKDTSTELVETCNNCGSKKLTRNIKYEKFLALPVTYGVVCCSYCKLSWLSPRPTAESFRELYEFGNYFSGDNVPQSYNEISQSRLYFFRKKLEKVIGDREAGLNILEIGAATGEFLNIAKQMGHRVYGVELSGDARAIAKNNYSIDLVEDISQLDKRVKYDFIHLNHVLEHVPDPKSMLVDLCAKISDDGYVLIEVPQQFDNDLDRLRRAIFPFRKSKFDAFSLHHTFFFNCENITSMCESAGLEVVTLKTALPERTPLSRPLVKNVVLRVFLFFSDSLHRGGNIIEVKLKRRGLGK